jgi:hypothetical protein
MQEAIKVEFKPSGRGKAQCPPNPAYPNGIEMDAAGAGVVACKVDLPYPAPECGVFEITCEACGCGVVITAAGRPDDPTSVKIPCIRTAIVT